MLMIVYWYLRGFIQVLYGVTLVLYGFVVGMNIDFVGLYRLYMIFIWFVYGFV
jgi:hypothetical protein